MIGNLQASAKCPKTIKTILVVFLFCDYIEYIYIYIGLDTVHLDLVQLQIGWPLQADYWLSPDHVYGIPKHALWV